MSGSRVLILLGGLLALVASASALGQAAVVEAVQYPAWLERGGNAVPLAPGTALQSRDQVRTGANARVHLRLSEGSAVKLGENAQIVIERIDDRGGLKGALAVLAGAFRFTTDKLLPNRPRDMSIRVKNVTAGIRGTDVWGKSTDARDLVCLLEGRISVAAEGHPQVTLDQPLDFYVKPRDGAPTVAKVDPKQVEQWALETDIARDGPAARTGGKWRVVAGKFPNRDEARVLHRNLRSAGYPADLIGGRDGALYAVQVTGFAGEEEARAAMANLRGVPGTGILVISETGSLIR